MSELCACLRPDSEQRSFLDRRQHWPKRRPFTFLRVLPSANLGQDDSVAPQKILGFLLKEELDICRGARVFGGEEGGPTVLAEPLLSELDTGFEYRPGILPGEWSTRQRVGLNYCTGGDDLLKGRGH